MTNLIAALIISTNTHWTVVRTEPSTVNCNVMGCKADHSEQRVEEAHIFRVVEAEFDFEGVKRRVAIKSEELPQSSVQQRIQYSGFDYVRAYPQWTTLTNNWVITR